MVLVVGRIGGMVLRKRNAIGLGRADITAHSVRKTRRGLSVHRDLMRLGTSIVVGPTISCPSLATSGAKP